MTGQHPRVTHNRNFLAGFLLGDDVVAFGVSLVETAGDAHFRWILLFLSGHCKWQRQRNQRCNQNQICWLHRLGKHQENWR